MLRDPKKFLALDTKLRAALTKVAKGELARQILNFKEGRQILYLLDQDFKTNVNLLGDDLSTFIHNWESVIAGMSHIPDEVTVRDILLRQIRKSVRMKYDLEMYDRAKDLRLLKETQEGNKYFCWGFSSMHIPRPLGGSRKYMPHNGILYY